MKKTSSGEEIFEPGDLLESEYGRVLILSNSINGWYRAKILNKYQDIWKRKVGVEVDNFCGTPGTWEVVNGFKEYVKIISRV